MALDFPDFSQSVNQHNIVSTLLSNFNIGSGGSPVLDVTAFSSIIVQANVPNVASVQRYLLFANWYAADGVTFIDQDVISFHSLFAYISLPRITWRLNCKGPMVKFVLTAGAGEFAITSVFASSDAVTGRNLSSYNGVGIDRLLLNYNATILAGGNSGLLFVPPVASKLAYTWSYSIAAGTFTLDANVSGGAGATSNRLGRITFTAPASDLHTFDVSWVGTEWTIFNGDAAAHGGSFQVWDVSP